MQPSSASHVLVEESMSVVMVPILMLMLLSPRVSRLLRLHLVSWSMLPFVLKQLTSAWRNLKSYKNKRVTLKSRNTLQLMMID